MKCLKCDKEMKILTIIGCDGLEVDVCREHGTWLDKGELRKLYSSDSKKGPHKRRVIKKKIDHLTSQIFDCEYEIKSKRAKQLKGI